MRFRSCLSVCLLCACAAAQTSSPSVTAPPAVGTKTVPPTLDQSLDMYAVSAPAISPDGLRVVYGQSRTDWDSDTFASDLWIASVAHPTPHRLTAPAKSAKNAMWSPDGHWIAFLSNRPGTLPKSPADKQQIWLIPADGGEAAQLTHFETGIEAFDWSPDSKSLVFTAADPETPVQKDRKESFGEYHIIHADYIMHHLWLADIPTDAALTPPVPVRLTEGAFSVDDFKISPDGGRVAFSAARDPDLISSFTSDIYTVTLTGHTVKKIADTPGPDSHPLWSPDGKTIAYLTSSAAPNFFYANNLIATVPSDGGAKPVLLNTTFDDDPQLLAWTPAGIYFTAYQKTAMRLFLMNPQLSTQPHPAAGGVVALSPAREVLGQPSLSPDGRHLAYRGAAPNEMAEIYTAELPNSPSSPTKAPWNARRITHIADQIAPFPHSTREVVSWKSGDGATVEGILEKPEDFQPGRRYPLLVIIHGGPFALDLPVLAPDRYYPAERFLARGALVLRPNYRGSAGYGAKFRALNVRNLGVGDYADVIGGVDSLIAQGLVDPKRVGAMGWSEGGYISAFITASSDRFQAVSVGAGISDWATYYYNTDITPFTRQYLGATPQTDPEIYRKTSPISYIGHAKTPTLIQQGSIDRRVPVANSYELRQALEDRGVPVKMVLYEGFGHPIDKPKQQRAVMEENELWFNHYLWNDPLPADLTPTKKAKPDSVDTKQP